MATILKQINDGTTRRHGFGIRLHMKDDCGWKGGRETMRERKKMQMSYKWNFGHHKCIWACVCGCVYLFGQQKCFKYLRVHSSPASTAYHHHCHPECSYSDLDDRKVIIKRAQIITAPGCIKFIDFIYKTKMHTNNTSINDDNKQWTKIGYLQLRKKSMSLLWLFDTSAVKFDCFVVLRW